MMPSINSPRLRLVVPLVLAAGVSLSACNSSDSPKASPQVASDASAGDAQDDATSDVSSPDGAEQDVAQDVSQDVVQHDSAQPDVVQDSPATDTSGDAAVPGTIGAMCEADKDCSIGLTCLKTIESWYGGGGPAGGYCSKTCTANTECADALAGAICVKNNAQWGATGYCVEGCAHGPYISLGTFGKFEATKCHGRKDVACQTGTKASFGTKGTFCWPVCGTDADCGHGLRCDKTSGTCVSTVAPLGKSPNGTNCTAEYHTDAGTGSKCLGECIQFETSDTACTHQCSTRCVVGRLDTCGMDQTPHQGGCLPTSVSMGTGDLGYCVQFCDTEQDCLDQPDKPSCDKSLLHLAGRGMCFPGFGQEGTCKY